MFGSYNIIMLFLRLSHGLWNTSLSDYCSVYDDDMGSSYCIVLLQLYSHERL